MKKFINKLAAGLAATSTFTALIQICDDEEQFDHYTLSEYISEFQLTYFSHNSRHQHDVVKMIENFTTFAEIEYDYLPDCKSYTATIHFKY